MFGVLYRRQDPLGSSWFFTDRSRAILLEKGANRLHSSAKGEIVSQARLFIKFLWFDMENRFIWLHLHSRSSRYSISSSAAALTGIHHFSIPTGVVYFQLRSITGNEIWVLDVDLFEWTPGRHSSWRAEDDGKYHARPAVLLIQRLYYPHVRTICVKSIGSGGETNHIRQHFAQGFYSNDESLFVVTAQLFFHELHT